MQGFKSFADRIELNFPFGVTGIVGPNGSGKSNISDAIRWVMGEQSIKTLRGSKMEDVIFLGSDTRKPMGMAEVTVVLDNTDGTLPLDYHEVAITRRLYRSGDGEYLINKTQVRLKDIHELLYDTGLGKEAYSVIGQGKIDAILSAKAEERRSVFEEAAGIVKYKNKKLVAMRKLADTDNHLLRVEDILGEITGQMDPVREQEALARKFVDFQNELQTIEINHMGAEIRRYEEDTQVTETRLHELEAKLEDEKRQELTFEAAMAEVKLRLTQIEDEINKEQDLFLGLTAEKGKYSGEDGLITEKIRTFGVRLGELELEIGRIRLKSQGVLADKERLAMEIETLRAGLTDVEAIMLEGDSVMTEKNKGLAEAKKAEDECRGRILAIHNRIAELKNQKNSAVLQKEFQNKQIREIEERLNNLEQNDEEIAEKADSVLSAIQLKNQEEDALKAETEKLKVQILQDENALAKKETRIQEERQNAQRLETRLGMLEEMEKGFQGYFQGVKSILSDARREPFSSKVRGIIADLIKVDRGFETAIEVALGSGLQFVVVETDTAAEEAVAFLKKNGQGRATFLPMNLVEGEQGKFPAAVLEAHRSKPAMEVLRFDERYRQTIAHLLGSTLVAPDLKTAIQLSRALGKRYRIVTAEGEIITPGGAITGGSLDKRRIGLLSRRSEIDALQADKDRTALLIQEIAKEWDVLKQQLTHERQTLEQSNGQLHRIQLEAGTIAKDQEKFLEQRNRLAQEMTQLKGRMEQLQRELVDENVSDLDIETAIGEAEEQLSAGETGLRECEAVIQAIEIDREAFQHQLAEQRSERVRAEQEVAGKKALVDGMVRQLQEADNECQRFEAEIQRIHGESAQAAVDQIQVRERLARLDQEAKLTEERLAGFRQQRESCRGEADVVEEKIKGVRLTTTALQQQMHRVDLQISRQRLTIESLTQHLVEAYGFDWDEHMNAEWTPPPNPQGRIETLRREIKELGPVNIGAIEEFQRLQERHDFLQKQYTDLTGAKETLQRVVTEIERTIRRRFLETFAEIRQAFAEIFNGLFTGGKADLFLVDPEDPLESGIEIIAQPPGKRLQTLSLLSGGERAMIAIALLFAILRVKPSPFCVLDEIDATLDDVNVSRFSDLLTDFSSELQYIVVTHRRGTMEIANALYGVTMEELGVSKLISIDLQKKVG